MSTIKTIGIVALLILAFGIVGQMDYEDAIAEEHRYCEMVRGGHWPEYKPEVDCKRIDQQHMLRGVKL